MPLYDYRCTNPKCDKYYKQMSFLVPLARFEEEVKCPTCKKPLKKLLAAPYFSVK